MQDEIFLDTVPLQHRRPRRQVRQPRRSGLLAAPGGDLQARCRSSRCAFRSTARSGRRRSSTTISTANIISPQDLSGARAAAAAAAAAAGGRRRSRSSSAPSAASCRSAATPQPKLTEESRDGVRDRVHRHVHERARRSACAFYVNDLDDSINFVQLPTNLDPYTAANPPPGWPLPPIDPHRDGAAGHLSCRERRSPISTSARCARRASSCRSISGSTANLTAFVNYSWQGQPQHPRRSESVPDAGARVAADEPVQRRIQLRRRRACSAARR